MITITISLKAKNKRITTWNVKSLGVYRKLDNVKLEMKRLKIDVLGMSETRWTEQGDDWSAEDGIICNGNERKKAEVG